MRKYRKWGFIALAILAVGAGIGIGVVAVQTGDLPEITGLEEYRPSATTRLFADDGELIAEFYMENRTLVTLDRVPPHVVNAFLAAEDPRFYRHSGIDLIGISRAMFKNIKAGRIVQGGSTITQQLAKMLFLEPDRTYARKLNELVLALQIERRYSKDEILNIYLNQVYLGSGAYGVEAAANTFFGKSVDQLTLAEGALIAGLPPAPSRYSPLRNPEVAVKRRRHVLGRMVSEGFITKAEMDAADRLPLALSGGRFVSARAPYFVEYVRQYLDEKYGTTALYGGGLNVYTTLNLPMQTSAEAAMRKRLAEVYQRHPREGKEIQGALLALEPHTGHIKAMVGGTDFSRSQFNRCTQAYRQPGSSFKPIVFAAALDKGYRPDDVVLDAPVSYPGATAGKRWRPLNYDKKFAGPVSLRRALARSINVVAVKLLDDVGIDTAISYARQLGIESPLSPYLPLALGASDVTLAEITGAYAAFDNFGIYIEPNAIEVITDRTGRVLEDNNPVTRQAVSPATAAAMTDLLTGVIQHGTGWQARELKRPVAGKTGTTSDYKDAWFVGYLPSMVCGVWVGYDDHKMIGAKETGASAALPIWLDFMKEYVEKLAVPVEEFPEPPKQGFDNRSGLKLKVVAPAAPPDADGLPDEVEVPNGTLDGNGDGPPDGLGGGHDGGTSGAPAKPHGPAGRASTALPPRAPATR
ncbi:MAG: PBP1A family penicillin-binding protein [Nitrospirae bacterium]|nr:PBP1A family penicillin-binding protein [Nitrospirota bacterium]